MRKCLFILAVFTMLLPAIPVFAISLPGATIPGPSPTLFTRISSLKEKDLRKQLGRKLTIKEKVAFFFLKKKAKKLAKEESKSGESAFVAGLIAIGLLVTGLFFPPLLIGSLVAAIVAVSSGSKALKLDRGNKKARTGRLLGWITIICLIGLVILTLIALAIFADFLDSMFG